MKSGDQGENGRSDRYEEGIERQAEEQVTDTEEKFTLKCWV